MTGQFNEPVQLAQVDPLQAQIDAARRARALTPPGDDAAGEYLRRAEQAELERLRAEMAAPLAEIPRGDPTGPATGKPKGRQDPAATAVPQAMQNVTEAAGRAVMGTGRAARDMPRAIAGGVTDAARNLLLGFDALGDWLENAMPLGIRTGTDKMVGAAGVTAQAMENPIEALAMAVPDVPQPNTAAGQVVRQVSNFLTAFIPILGAIGKGGNAVATFARGEAAAAGAGALVLDPFAERLSNLIEQVPALKNPVTDYLAADPNDSRAEGMFKSAVESIVVSPLAQGVVLAVRGLRAWRGGRGADDARAPLDVAEAPLSGALGDPTKPLVIATESGSFQMNWARWTTTEDIEATVTEVADRMRGTLDDARRGTITDEALAGLADRLGMTPAQLAARAPGGVAWDAERILAAKSIVEASAEKLFDLSKAAATSADGAALYDFRRMFAVHAMLQAEFQGVASEAGRALRALQLPAGSRAKQLQHLDALLAQDGGADRIRSLAAAIARNDPKDIDRLARGSVGKRITDVVVEAWYFALLSGPQTHAVNMATSGVNAVWQVGERFLASQFATLRGANDSVAAGEASAMLYGYAGAFATALRASSTAFVRNEASDVFGKVETRSRGGAESFALSGPQGGLPWLFGKSLDGLSAVARTPGRFLMAEDEFYRVVGKDAQIRALALRQAKAEGLEGLAAGARIDALRRNPTQEMMDSALDFARSLTFTTPLGQGAESFSRGINQLPVFKVALPFVRTPVNLVKFAGTRSPLAPLAASVRADLAAGGARGDLAAARIAMGTMLMMTAADMAMSGVLTGGGPTDPGLQETWRRTQQPYSVKVGDTWYSYNRGDPFGMMLGIAADYAAIAGEIGERDAGELIAAAALATSKSVFSKSWMQGPANMVEALSNPDRHGERWVQGLLGTFLVPTGIAQFARVQDPHWREVGSILDAIKARTPGYSTTLPPRLNIWGEPIIREGALGPELLSPIYTMREQVRPVDVWLVENRVPLAMPSKSQLGLELSPQEYNRFVELAGVPAYATLTEIVAGRHAASDSWRLGTDGPEGGRARIVRGVLDGFRDRARAQLLTEFPELRLRVEERAGEAQRALTGQPRIQ